ncbi:MAG: hypothetical protein V1859_06325 [archaeon]
MKMDWKGCKDSNMAKRIEPDFRKAGSIILAANDRESTAKMLPLNETTKETILSLMYDVLRELLEALALQHGYKIYNHECFTSFLRDIINDEKFALDFDSARQLRNSINYYGKKILIDDANSSLSDINKMISRARKLLDDNRK